MPITFEQVLEIAQQELLSKGGQLFLWLDKTREFDVGWVFYYQAARFLETGDRDEMLVGSAPMFVSRSSGEIASVSYHRPLEKSISAYRACGDIFAHQIPRVRLLRAREDASTTQAIQAIRKFATYGISQAKEIVTASFSGSVNTIRLPSFEAAESLVSALAVAGFDAEIEYSTPRKI